MTEGMNLAHVIARPMRALPARPCLVDDVTRTMPRTYLATVLALGVVAVACVTALGPGPDSLTTAVLVFAAVCSVASVSFSDSTFEFGEAFYVGAFVVLQPGEGATMLLVASVVVSVLYRPPSIARAGMEFAGNLVTNGAALVAVHLAGQVGGLSSGVLLAVVGWLAIRAVDTTVLSMLYRLRWGSMFRWDEHLAGSARNYLQALTNLPLALVIVLASQQHAWVAALLLVPFATHGRAVSVQKALVGDVMVANSKLARGNLQFAAAMVRALDARDAYTAAHSAAVAVYARDIALAMGEDEEVASLAHLAGILHDVGKIGVREQVLNKAGRLTEQEFDEIRQHSAIGAGILAEVDAYHDLAVIVRHHHERIDGRGYPDRIAGSQIPLVSRMIAVADTYSALTTDRPYRAGMAPDRAIGILREAAADGQLEPAMTHAFIDILDARDDMYRRGRLQGFDVEAARHYALVGGQWPQVSVEPPAAEAA